MTDLTAIKPVFTPPHGNAESDRAPEPAAIQSILDTLSMMTHVEGGYFVETDRDPATVPSPWPASEASSAFDGIVPQRPGFDSAVRNASTTIFYLLTPGSPQGNFHRNKARTVHTLHKGRGRYVLIHADEAHDGKPPRIETFVVGQDVAKGERLQWIVEGGKYKASFLMPDREGEEGSAEGLLISETVVPGFEFCDHDFLKRDGLVALLGGEKSKELDWLVRE